MGKARNRNTELTTSELLGAVLYKYEDTEEAIEEMVKKYNESKEEVVEATIRLLKDRVLKLEKRNQELAYEVKLRKTRIVVDERGD